MSIFGHCRKCENWEPKSGDDGFGNCRPVVSQRIEVIMVPDINPSLGHNPEIIIDRRVVVDPRHEGYAKSHHVPVARTYGSQTSSVSKMVVFLQK